ncbi:MAG: hypothetical protein AAF611_19565 [Bacteroidota bacterium]
MKKKPTKDLRFKKCSISNLNAIVAGAPPPPPGSNSCVQDQTCFTVIGQTCNNSCFLKCS